MTDGMAPSSPRARAASRPATVRARIRSASNSATAAKMWNVRRPVAVVVSMPSFSGRGSTPRRPRSATVATRCCTERPRLSRRQTTGRHRTAGSRAPRTARIDRRWSRSRGRSGPDRTRRPAARRAAAPDLDDRSTPSRTSAAHPCRGACGTRHHPGSGHTGSGHEFRTHHARRVADGATGVRNRRFPVELPHGAHSPPSYGRRRPCNTA
jgi:hypothetical protein